MICEEGGGGIRHCITHTTTQHRTYLHARLVLLTDGPHGHFAAHQLLQRLRVEAVTTLPLLIVPPCAEQRADHVVVVGLRNIGCGGVSTCTYTGQRRRHERTSCTHCLMPIRLRRYCSRPSAVFMKPCSRMKASPRRIVWSLKARLLLVISLLTPSCGTRPASVWSVLRSRKQGYASVGADTQSYTYTQRRHVLKRHSFHLMWIWSVCCNIQTTVQ